MVINPRHFMLPEAAPALDVSIDATNAESPPNER